MEIVREVTLEEAEPGDRVTLVGTLTDRGGTNRGLYVYQSGLCLFDGDVVISVSPWMEVTVEREVPTTSQEPRGLGAVVRAVGDDLGVFVRQSAKPGTGTWQRHLDDLEWDEYTWSEVLEHGRGAVEVLSEGWAP